MVDGEGSWQKRVIGEKEVTVSFLEVGCWERCKGGRSKPGGRETSLWGLTKTKLRGRDSLLGRHEGRRGDGWGGIILIYCTWEDARLREKR